MLKKDDVCVVVKRIPSLQELKISQGNIVVVLYGDTAFKYPYMCQYNAKRDAISFSGDELLKIGEL